MTRSHPPDKPRDYFSRREQWRLLLLVMSLGLVFILMNEVRKPERWRWLIPDSPPSDRPSEPGESVHRAWIQRTTSNTEEAQPAANQSPSDTAETNEPDTSSDDAGGADAGRYFAGVRPELLAAIHDKTRFRAEESDAWFHLFAVLRAADPAKLRRASIGRIARLQLSEQSAAYRGELVTIRGVIRRAHRLTAPANAQGIAGYYQVWIQPDDSPEWPIVVYALEWPNDWPTGMHLSRPASVTGFYFKRWLYQAKDGLELAPVVLARGIDPVVAESSGLFSWSLWSGIAVVVAALLGAAVIVSYVYKRTTRKPSDPPP